MSEHIRYLSHIDERPAGSKACRDVAHFLSDTLHAYGFSIKEQNFHVHNIDQIAEVQSSNIIATKEGRTRKKIVFTAHYDGYPQSPAANDNASGVLTLLLLAYVLGNQNLSNFYTIEILMLTGEETDSQGAFKYLFPNLEWSSSRFLMREVYKTPSWRSSVDNVEFIVSLDCVGRGQLFAIYREQSLPIPVLKALEDLEAHSKLLAFDFPWEPHQGDGSLFLMLDLPVICFGRYDRDVSNVIHTEYDTFSLLKVDDLINTASICLKLVKQVGE